MSKPDYKEGRTGQSETKKIIGMVQILFVICDLGNSSNSFYCIFGDLHSPVQ